MRLVYDDKTPTNRRRRVLISIVLYVGFVSGVLLSCTDTLPNTVDGSTDSSLSPDVSHADGSADASLDACSIDGSDAGDAADAADATSTTKVHPSCADGGFGMSNCGTTGTESCCATLDVVGGSFLRSYDDAVYLDAGHPATISTFALDKYLVTVGRFRNFVTASAGGWQPNAGDGKHAYLTDGGVSNSAAPGTYESGWNTNWTSQLATSAAAWDINLECASTVQTWTSTPSSNESLPINCVDWYEAYAFCIWDGGFLPTEAEWNYAASGGSDQRIYPWSNPPTSTTIDCSHAIYNGCGGPNAVGSESPQGDGKWGHTDLGGQAFEWTLDAYADYVTPCADCSYLAASPTSVSARSGSYCSPTQWLLASARSPLPPTNRGIGFGGGCGTGLRCARAP